MDLAQQETPLEGDDERLGERVGIGSGRQHPQLAQAAQTVAQGGLPAMQARGDGQSGRFVELGELAAQRADGAATATVEGTVHPDHPSGQRPSPAMAHHLTVGDQITPRTIATLDGPVQLPDGTRTVHLQLRRFAGCPVCNLHLRSVVLREPEIADAGIRAVVVFHSSAAELEQYQAELPFDVVPDPRRELYREFGADSSVRAVLSPRLWVHVPRIVRGVLRDLVHGRRAPRLRPNGGQLGLPADILISHQGRILAVTYGEHAYDQWSVDELLEQARRVSP